MYVNTAGFILWQAILNYVWFARCTEFSNTRNDRSMAVWATASICDFDQSIVALLLMCRNPPEPFWECTTFWGQAPRPPAKTSHMYPSYTVLILGPATPLGKTPGSNPASSRRTNTTIVMRPGTIPRGRSYVEEHSQLLRLCWLVKGVTIKTACVEVCVCPFCGCNASKGEVRQRLGFMLHVSYYSKSATTVFSWCVSHAHILRDTKKGTIVLRI